jgi:hypothetical protein
LAGFFFLLSFHSKFFHYEKKFLSFSVTEWYAPGFGVVKTESGNGNTEITSIRMIPAAKRRNIR